MQRDICKSHLANITRFCFSALHANLHKGRFLAGSVITQLCGVVRHRLLLHPAPPPLSTCWGVCRLLLALRQTLFKVFFFLCPEMCVSVWSDQYYKQCTSHLSLSLERPECVPWSRAVTACVCVTFSVFPFCRPCLVRVVICAVLQVQTVKL